MGKVLNVPTAGRAPLFSESFGKPVAEEVPRLLPNTF